MAKDNNMNKSNTSEKGLFSNMMGYNGGGHYYPSGAYPPYSGCLQPCYPPGAYPPGGGYPPHGGYGYPPVAYPYASSSYHSGYGANMGAMLGGGAATVYGTHHFSHGHGHSGHGCHGKFKHGKFRKRWKHHGFFRRHKYKCWK